MRLKGKRPRERCLEWDDDDLEILQEFLDESYDELSDCEAALNAAQEAGEASRDHVDELFRKIHSIKGVASSFDLEDITNLTHITEEVLAAARDEKLTVSGGILTTIFDSVDVTRRLLDVLKSAMMTSSAIARLPEVPLLCEALDGIMEGKIPESSVLGGLRMKKRKLRGWMLGPLVRFSLSWRSWVNRCPSGHMRRLEMALPRARSSSWA